MTQETGRVILKFLSSYLGRLGVLLCKWDK